MFFGLINTAHEATTKAKQAERQQRIDELPLYQAPVTAEESKILKLPAESVVEKVQAHEIKPLTVLHAYGKRALACQKENNSLTEIMIKSAEKWAGEANLKGPLAGFPVSLKDTCAVAGYDCSLGYSKNCFKPLAEDSAIVRIIKDAGGYPYVKTNIPFTLLSFESYNDVWGVSENPHVHGYTPGGSTGGEGALLAYGGSRIGIGTDVAGSVRAPAHFSGIYSIKCTTTRFPKAGNCTTTLGQEGVPAVYSPMARTLGDLNFLFKTIIDMKPWNYDYTVTELPYKEPKLQKPKFGVVWTDGIVDPSPACLRALKDSVSALKKQGYEVVDFTIPEPLEALTVGAQLLCSDGIETATNGMLYGEHNDAGVGRAYNYAHLPCFVRKIWAWFVEKVYGDKIWATLLRDFSKKTINERWALVMRREGYKAKFFDEYKASGVDFLITPPNATPALPHKGLFESFSSCLYTFLFNIVDYPAGIIPVTKVDRKIDALPETFSLKSLNGVARGAYINYDADKMHGLPVGVQVVGPRFHEEDVLAAMGIVEDSLKKSGIVYQLLN